MLYAISEIGEKILPFKHGRAHCPECDGLVIARCGEIMPPHWAHQSLRDCDDWYEPESAWHLAWKGMFPKEQVEISISRNNRRHRADIVGDEGTVIELQHSAISPETIHERENFYENMIWIFDASSKQRDFRRVNSLTEIEFQFRWLYPKRSVISCEHPVYLDFGLKKLLRITKLSYTGFGEGHYKDKAEFILEYGGTPEIDEENTPRIVY